MGTVDGTERQLAKVPEVARFLSLSRSKVYAMMDGGELPYIKIGKSRRLRWSDVLALVEANIVSSNAKDQ